MAFAQLAKFPKTSVHPKLKFNFGPNKIPTEISYFYALTGMTPLAKYYYYDYSQNNNNNNVTNLYS